MPGCRCCWCCLLPAGNHPTHPDLAPLQLQFEAGEGTELLAKHRVKLMSMTTEKKWADKVGGGRGRAERGAVGWVAVGTRAVPRLPPLGSQGCRQWDPASQSDTSFIAFSAQHQFHCLLSPTPVSLPSQPDTSFIAFSARHQSHCLLSPTPVSLPSQPDTCFTVSGAAPPPSGVPSRPSAGRRHVDAAARHRRGGGRQAALLCVHHGLRCAGVVGGWMGGWSGGSGWVKRGAPAECLGVACRLRVPPSQPATSGVLPS